jgi:hypothetical protein
VVDVAAQQKAIRSLHPMSRDTQLGSMLLLWWRAPSKLSVRPATDEEVVIYEQAVEVAKPSDDMVLAFLIELDV